MDIAKESGYDLKQCMQQKEWLTRRLVCEKVARSQDCMKREHAREIAKSQPTQCAGKGLKKYVLMNLCSKCCKELDNEVCKERSDQQAGNHTNSSSEFGEKVCKKGSKELNKKLCEKCSKALD